MLLSHVNKYALRVLVTKVSGQSLGKAKILSITLYNLVQVCMFSTCRFLPGFHNIEPCCPIWEPLATCG